MPKFPPGLAGVGPAIAYEMSPMEPAKIMNRRKLADLMFDMLCTIEPTPGLESREFARRSLFCRRRFAFFLPVPQMERVSENDIAEDVVRAVVCNINRRIELQIARQVASESDGR